MRGQILIDQGEQNDPRRRLYFGDSLVELHLAAYEGINMLNRRLPFVLRRDGAAGGNQGFARRVGNQMQMEVMSPQEISCLFSCHQDLPFPWLLRKLMTINTSRRCSCQRRSQDVGEQVSRDGDLDHLTTFFASGI